VVFLRVSGGDVDIEGSQGTSTGGGGDTVGEDLVTDLLEVGIGEDEADVACEIVNACQRAMRPVYIPRTWGRRRS
jgi:hypothetical protein